MKMLLVIGALLLVATGGAAAGQDKPKPIGAHSKVDQEKVDAAIQSGCKFLLNSGTAWGVFSHGKRHQPEAKQAYGELILLTLLHSGYYTENDPLIQPIIENLLQKDIGSTYTASLQAMALQKANAKKHHKRISECAQFLVDNQCENGQWDYGDPTPPPVPSALPPKAKPKEDVATAGGTVPPAPDASGASVENAGKGTRAAPKTNKTTSIPRIPIRRKKPGPPNGDNSNSQYAALGLRACLDAGVDIEASVLQKARQWWLRSQNSDGGWGYNGDGNMGGGENETSVSNTSYGSMTVGAVGAMCIYNYYLGLDFKGDPSVRKGLDWLFKYYDVTKNPKKKEFAYLYYLYGLERVGMLYGTEKIGNYEWYPDGAKELLRTQQAGGPWVPNDTTPREPQVNTCFAILFLRRGTMPLRPVATGGGGGGEAGTARPDVANPGSGAVGAPGSPVSRTVESIAPGFKLSGFRPGTGILLSEVGGRKDVLVVHPAAQGTPAVFRRMMSIPGGKPVLKLTVGHSEKGSWELIVRVDTKDLLSRVIGPDTSSGGWLDLELPLAAYAGKSEVLVELYSRSSGRDEDAAYWSYATVKSE